jgi:hypothetical protein
VIAIYLLIGNTIAFTVAPTAVAVISSHILRDPRLIGAALAIVSIIAVPIGILLLLAARRDFIASQVSISRT